MRKGQSHAIQSREKIRDWNIENRGKAVLCLDTGKAFETISAAARKLHVAPVQISRVCNGERQSVRGHAYRFIEEVQP